MATKDLNVILGLRVENFQKNLKFAQRSMMKFGRDMERLGSNLTKTLTLPIIGVGTGAIKAFTDIERFEKGLTAIMGSSEAAATELQNLQKAARMPGLGFKEAVQGSIRLQSVGFSANEARETLMAFGAAIAATGGTAQNLESVQYQLTQMISKNRILQEDFSIIQENVPLVGKAIEVAFGTRNIEQIRATGISAEDFNRRIVAALKTLPETQTAVGGLGNAFENLKDTLTVSFAEFGRAINESLKLEDKIEILGNLVQNLVQRFKALSPEAKQTAVNIALFVSAIGPAVFIVGKLATTIGGLLGQMRSLVGIITTLASPVGIALALVGIITAMYFEFENVRKVVNGLLQTFYAFLNTVIQLGKQLVNFTSLLGAIQSGNVIRIKVAFDELKDGISELPDAVADGFKNISFTDAENKVTSFLDRIKQQIFGVKTEAAKVIPSSTQTPTSTPSGSGGGIDTSQANSTALLNTALISQVESINQVKSAQESLNETFASTQERQQGLIETNNARLEQDQKIQESIVRGQTLLEGITSITATVTDSIFGALERGQNVFKSLTQGLKQMIVQLIKAIAQAAIFATILSLIPGGSAVGKLLGGIGLKTGKGSFGANIFGMLGLASGGLVTGPTMALVGEGSGTSISNPEVVAPLDKLRSMLSGTVNNNGFVASTKLQGSDLLLVVERAERNRNR